MNTDKKEAFYYIGGTVIICSLVLLSHFSHMKKAEQEAQLEQAMQVEDEEVKEMYAGQPALVKSFEKKTDGTYSLSLDIVNFNQEFIPEGNEEFYTNNNSEITTFETTKETKFTECGPNSKSLPDLEAITNRNYITISTQGTIITEASGICVP